MGNACLFPLKMECKVPFEEINILHNGDWVLCRQDWNNSVIFGNLVDNSIGEIWWGEKFNQFRKNFFQDTEKVFPCNRCNRNEWYGMQC